MKKFCTSCGTVLAEDVRFCENCGAPVGGPTGTSFETSILTKESPTPVSKAANQPTRRRSLFVAAAIVVALAGGLGAWWLISRDAGPSEADARAIFDQWGREGHLVKGQARPGVLPPSAMLPCLSPFSAGVRTKPIGGGLAYSPTVIHQGGVPPMDVVFVPRQWEAFARLLAREGLVEDNLGPTIQRPGVFPKEASKYWVGYDLILTDKGRSAFRMDRICYADAMAPRAVNVRSGSLNGTPVAAVDIELDFVNPAPWIADPAAEAMREIFGFNYSWKRFLEKKDGRWQIAGQNELEIRKLFDRLDVQSNKGSGGPEKASDASAQALLDRVKSMVGGTLGLGAGAAATGSDPSAKQIRDAITQAMLQGPFPENLTSWLGGKTEVKLDSLQVKAVGRPQTAASGGQYWPVKADVEGSFQPVSPLMIGPAPERRKFRGGVEFAIYQDPYGAWKAQSLE